MERVGDEQADNNGYEESYEENYEEKNFMDNIKEKHA